jgi:galactonate dehydratase
MKITDLRGHVMSIPRLDGTGVMRNWIFVEVKTDEGITGIGEATTEYHEMAVKAQVETELKPRLLGMDPTDIKRI